jgi:RNA polymerase sigma factor (sigma-70 family)
VSPPHPEPASSADQSRWFANEVQAHEASLRSYLHGSFPRVRDVDDVVQESYLRIWRTRAAEPIRSARAFLFRVARNIALDLVRRNKNSPITAVGDLAELPVIEDKRGVAETISIDEKVALLADAIAALPPRCRQVVMLCKLKGLTHREAAAELGISERTVDEQILRGLKRLDEELRKRGVSSCFAP